MMMKIDNNCVSASYYRHRAQQSTSESQVSSPGCSCADLFPFCDITLNLHVNPSIATGRGDTRSSCKVVL